MAINHKELKPGDQLLHVRSGKVVEFRRINRIHRGIVKVETSELDFGPLDLRVFELVEKPKEQKTELPPWKLKTPPADYLAKCEASGKGNKDNIALAKLYVEAE
jgi:hypothetical protein